ncbi:MAG: dATP/dGTP diphosphohydrolase domain-containing protein [Verrucomicrobiota bacterium]
MKDWWIDLPKETRVYLAGPMRGIPHFNFPAFDKAAGVLRSGNLIVFSPAERDRQDGFDPVKNPDAKPKTLAHYMAIDLPEVCKADAVVVLPGWEKSQGANMEVYTAHQCGIPVYAYLTGRRIKLDLVSPAADPTPATGEVRITDAATGGQKGVKPERFDLIPTTPLEELARVYGYGATKYAEDNWRKGYAWNLNFGAMLRHAWAFWRGEDRDAESGCHHLAHVAWHCLTLMWFQTNGRGTDTRKDKTS